MLTPQKKIFIVLVYLFSLNSYSTIIETNLHKKIIPISTNYMLITNASSQFFNQEDGYVTKKNRVTLTKTIHDNNLIGKNLKIVVVFLKYQIRQNGILKIYQTDVTLDGKNKIINGNDKIIIDIPDNPNLFEINSLSYESINRLLPIWNITELSNQLWLYCSRIF
ncbi:MAG: hypothetical protein HRT87_06350 [Legionellales bacterium]|nr:hypothetical protein [Legionellales bacterium]